MKHETVKHSGTSMEDTPVSLNDNPGTKSKPIDFQISTSPVNRVCVDVCEVHSTDVFEVKVTPAISRASEQNLSHMPVSCGKVTKEVVMETFKDVHTGLGTLGPPLHITMNPSGTAIQGAEVIRDLEKQGPEKVTEPIVWISNSV